MLFITHASLVDTVKVILCLTSNPLNIFILCYARNPLNFFLKESLITIKRKVYYIILKISHETVLKYKLKYLIYYQREIRFILLPTRRRPIISAQDMITFRAVMYKYFGTVQETRNQATSTNATEKIYDKLTF